MPFINEPFAQTLFLSLIYVTTKMPVDALLIRPQPRFLTLALLTFWTRYSFVMGLPCALRGLAVFLASIHEMLIHS